MIDEKIYQKIYDELNVFLVPEWKKLIVYLEYGEGSYTFSFYIKGEKDFFNGYDLPNVSEKKIDDAFKKIDKIVLKERMKEKDDLWTNMTMVVSKFGDFHVDFDYTDLSKDAYQYKKNWKKKYLK